MPSPPPSSSPPCWAGSPPLQGRSAHWSSFGGLIIAYAVVLVVSTLVSRAAGWLNWGATIRSFARAITNGYDHLIELSHRWHTDRPSGEVISSLETFSWAFVEVIDMVTWGLLRVAVTVLGAIVVLAIFAWPVAVILAVLAVVFGGVLWRRMAKVVAAEQEFSDTHSQATGVIADTVANLTTVRTQATEEREKSHVADVVAASVRADLRARRVFSATRLQMESSMAVLNWAAIVIGLVLALHHVVAASAIYLVLFYATYVGNSLEESFEYVRVISRALGRCAKFVGIAETEPEIRDAPVAPDLWVTDGRLEFRDVHFSYRPDAPLFRGLDVRIEPGEHVGLVGSSGSGKTTLTKLILRFMDIEGGAILLDGQDNAEVTQRSLRDHISYVPQDPQMLHRTIAENICYGVPGLDRPDMDLVGEVGRAAHVEEFVRTLPDGYDTVVGERGLKLSGGQRQRVAIAQAMAKAAPVPHPRRGHLRPRLGVGVPRPRGAVAAHGGLDRARRGPSVGHHRPVGPHSRPRTRRRGRGGHPRRPTDLLRRRRLPPVVGAPVGWVSGRVMGMWRRGCVHGSRRSR